MNMKLNSLFALAAMFALGCSTIKEAREAQEALADKCSEDKAATILDEKVNLVGSSLEELVAYALDHRETLTKAALNVQDAHLAMKALRADAPLISSTPWTAPKVGLSASYGESSAPVHAKDFDGKLERGKLGAAVSLDLLVYDFGRHDAKLKAAAENVIAAEVALASARYDVFEEVTEAYFDLREARTLLAVAKASEEKLKLHLERAEKRYEAGESLKLDVTKAALDLSEAKDKVVAAENQVETSGAKILAALGIAADQARWTDVVEENESDFYRYVGAFNETTMTTEEGFELGCANYPAIRIARARLRAASDEVDYAVADLKPSLSLNASLNFSDPLWWWKWGVGASQNLFSGFRKTTAVDRAVVAMKSAASDVDRTEHELSLAISLAVAERDNARVAYETSEESVNNAQAYLILAEERYNVGDLSQVDFNDSVVDHETALGTRVKAYYRGQRAESKIFRLIGMLPEYVSNKEEAK